MKQLIFALTLLVAALSTPFSQAMALDNGTTVPDFSAMTYDGKEFHFNQLQGKTVVLEWFNPHCPFVRKHYRQGHMPKLQSEYIAQGVAWVMVNSTGSAKRDYFDSDSMARWLEEQGVKGVTVLNDSSGKIGRLFGARTTPHMFVIDGKGVLSYQGAIDDDDSASGNPLEAKNYVRQALDALSRSAPIEVASTDAYGCSVKYSL